MCPKNCDNTGSFPVRYSPALPGLCHTPVASTATSTCARVPAHPIRATAGEYVACTLLWCQQPDDDARESLLDHAWAAVHLLRNEDCIQIESPPRPTRLHGIATTMTVTASTIAEAYAVASKPTLVASSRVSTSMATTAVGSTSTIKNPYRSMLAVIAGGKKITTAAGTQAPALAAAEAAAAAAPRAAAAAETAPKGIFANASSSDRQRRREETLGGVLHGVGVGGARGALSGRGDPAAMAFHHTVSRNAPQLPGQKANGGAGGGAGGEGAGRLSPTKLGLAIFRSSMAPGDGLVVFRELSGESRLLFFFFVC